jgi:NADH-quinone oxidoreductase subunit N
MNLGAFTVAGLIQRQTGGQSLSDLRGLSTRNPILAFCMAACMFSLIGIPPLAGFTAKLNIMLVLSHGGAMGWILVAVIAINTVISLYYYARVVKAMYFESSELSPFGTKFIGGAISVLCAIALIGMLVGFNPLLKLTSQYSQMFSPIPITAVAAKGR